MAYTSQNDLDDRTKKQYKTIIATLSYDWARLRSRMRALFLAYLVMLITFVGVFFYLENLNKDLKRENVILQGVIDDSNCKTRQLHHDRDTVDGG